MCAGIRPVYMTCIHLSLSRISNIRLFGKLGLALTILQYTRMESSDRCTWRRCCMNLSARVMLNYFSQTTLETFGTTGCQIHDHSWLTSCEGSNFELQSPKRCHVGVHFFHNWNHVNVEVIWMYPFRMWDCARKVHHNTVPPHPYTLSHPSFVLSFT